MKIRAVACNTFREAIRDKVLYSLLFFAAMMIGVSLILDHLTIGERTKIIKDFGLASIAIFGVMIAIFVGIGLVYKEIERKTIYNILSKPIYRYQFIIGKYIGLIMTIFIEVLIMSVVLLLMLYLYDGQVDFILLYAIGMIFLELMIVTASALLFSSFSTPILSGLFTLSFYVIGHLTTDLLALGQQGYSQAVAWLTKILYYILPDLNYFNLKGQVVYNIPVEKEHLCFVFCYGIIYIVLILSLAIIIFQKRDFK